MPIRRTRRGSSRPPAREWLHLVDLNGAFAGKPVNAAAVEAILKAVKVPVQLGGGIRHLAQIEDWFARGIARVILGTVALKNPALVKEACRKFPGKIAVGIDAKGGKVAVEGWAETSDVTALDLARKFEDAGVAAIIFTDIDRDGLLQGVNVESTAQLARSISVPVIASGGVSSLADIDALLKIAPSDAQLRRRHHRRDLGPRAVRRQSRSRRGAEAAEGGGVMNSLLHLALFPPRGGRMRSLANEVSLGEAGWGVPPHEHCRRAEMRATPTPTFPHRGEGALRGESLAC